MDGFNGGGIGMMGLANADILLGDCAGRIQGEVTIGQLQNLRMFLDKFIPGFLGQQIPGLAGDFEVIR